MSEHSFISKKENKKYKNKEITKPNFWTEEEDKILKEKAEEYNYKNWNSIANFIPGRTSIQCSARYRRIRPGLIKGAWDKEEDNKLLSLYEKYGKNWAAISKEMPHRTGKQIRDRFLNSLDSKFERGKFTEEEDQTIIKYYKIYGNSWAKIAKKLKTRTGDMVKNRFYSSLKKTIFKNRNLLKRKRERTSHKNKIKNEEENNNPVNNTNENINPKNSNINTQSNLKSNKKTENNTSTNENTNTNTNINANTNSNIKNDENKESNLNQPKNSTTTENEKKEQNNFNILDNIDDSIHENDEINNQKNKMNNMSSTNNMSYDSNNYSDMENKNNNNINFKNSSANTSVDFNENINTKQLIISENENKNENENDNNIDFNLEENLKKNAINNYSDFNYNFHMNPDFFLELNENVNNNFISLNQKDEVDERLEKLKNYPKFEFEYKQNLKEQLDIIYDLENIINQKLFFVQKEIENN